MKVGDIVNVINKQSKFFGYVGRIVEEDKELFTVELICDKFKSNYQVFNKTEVGIEKIYHLDLSLEDMNALAELGKMKDNLGLLERLLKRAKSETND